MTEKQLLEEIKEQATIISTLRSENQRLREQLETLPDQIYLRTVRQLANTAVNCGQSSSCAVAGWALEAIEKRESKAV